MFGATGLRGDGETGEETGLSDWRRDGDAVGSDAPGVGSSRIGSSLDRGSRPVCDLERILDARELGLDLNGSERIELELSALR